MCEQTPMAYKEEDIVWVKLGPCWWPGEVVSFDKLPSEVIESLRKRPLAVVKFFDEENYEFVKNLNNIYSYNTNKKYEFIKKGLDLYRAKHNFMEKFPSDVCIAETKTGGNPNILNDPQLTPEKKIDYTAIFGSPTPKRGSKESQSRVKSKHSFSRHSSSASPKKHSSLITHPRFLSKGKDDHEVRILIQVATDEVKSPQQEYTCHTCGFKSTRVDVIVLHNKSHIKGVYTPVSVTKKTKRSPKKPRKVSPPNTSDFKTGLLAEWDDEDEDDDKTETTNTSQDLSPAIEEKNTKKHQLDKGKLPPKKSMKMSYSKTTSLDEDLALIEDGISLFSDTSSDKSDDDVLKTKKKLSPSTGKEKRTKKLDSSSDESDDGFSSSKKKSSPVSSPIETASGNKKDTKVREEHHSSSDEYEGDLSKRKEKLSSLSSPIKKATGSKTDTKIRESMKRIDSSSDESDEKKLSPIEKASDDKKDTKERTKTLQSFLDFEKEIAKDNLLLYKPKNTSKQSARKSKNDLSSDEFDYIPVKSKRKQTSALPVKAKKSKISPIPPPAKSDIKSDLLAEWDDDDDDDDGLEDKDVKPASSFEIVKEAVKEIVTESKTEQKDKSCFDFDEEEDIELLAKSKEGRKIPRVIPPADKRKSIEFELSDVVESKETEIIKEDTKVKDVDDTETVVESNNEKETEASSSDMEAAFNNILATTAVPELPEVPCLLKCEQNFHSANTIKFPDKVASIESIELGLDVPQAIFDNAHEEPPINELVEDVLHVETEKLEEEVKTEVPPTSSDVQKTTLQTEVATKLTNPKKRFVKTFEDETKHLTGKEDTKSEEPKNLEVSKLKTLLMSKLNVNSYKNSTILTKEVDCFETTESHSPEQILSQSSFKPNLPEKFEKDVFEDDEESEFSTKDEIWGSTNDVLKIEEPQTSPKMTDLEIDDVKDQSPLMSFQDETEKKFDDENFGNFLKNKPDNEESVDDIVSDNLNILNDETQDNLKIVEEVEVHDDHEIVCQEEILSESKAAEEKFDLDIGVYNLSDEVKDIVEAPDVVEDIEALPVVNENDSTDKQVEVVESKPITLSTFSMDFCEDNTSDDKVVDKIEDEAKSPVQLSQDIEENISSFEINKHATLEEVVPETCDKIVTDEKEENSTESMKEEQSFLEKSATVESEVAKITDTNNDDVLVEHLEESTSSTKLLEILTDVALKPEIKADVPAAVVKEKTMITSKILNRIDAKLPKIVNKSSIKKLIPEKVISESETMVSVKKVTSKRTYQDVEDIDTFIIHKPIKKIAVSDVVQDNVQVAPVTTTQKGKARILQQTIITPTGDIIQPTVSQNQTDDNMFDINSMPIVLDDQILTPESIENMPIVLQETVKPAIVNPIKKPAVKLLNKTMSPVTALPKTQASLIKQYTPNKQTKVHKVYQTGSTKLLKSNPAVITQPGKPGKFIIVPSSSAPTGNKYTVGKKPPIIKRSTINTSVTKVQSIAPEPAGNKIMIVTNNLGQQQRVLLTPVQQKMLAYQSTTNTKVKPILKSTIQPKSITTKTANIISQTIVSTKCTSANQTVTSPSVFSSAQLKSIKVDPAKMKKIPPQNQKLYLQGINPVSKPSTSGTTIIIKNPQGQTVKRIQSTDDSLIEQQVQQQIQAINRAATVKPLSKDHLKNRAPIKKSYAKKIVGDSTKLSTKSNVVNKSSLPPLAPISPLKKSDSSHSQAIVVTNTNETQSSSSSSSDDKSERLPHQLVIQDAHGNQTTITEGQILALPSEAIDGQPQSYVLVTLDETGNLAPLNNEALMSLDPNLSLGGDLGNMVLQIDQGGTTESETATNPANILPKTVEPENTPPQNNNANQQSVETNSVGGDTGQQQQLIITGDPLSTQKFLESLTEGNADLANLLANTKGNILIQAEGQQILINTDTENQMLLTVNPENLSTAVENSEGSGNPLFANQPMKNQDILAAALADTDVFQQEQSISQSPSKGIQSQLSPSNALYPIHAGNVLETNSMNSPIMTPLEVPSTNNKKVIDDQAEILSQIPKNIDLPITITDPNISQTVSHQQQVASLMAADLELPLTIQDPTMSVTSSEINSPSFVYSLPTLDDTVNINQKTFSTSISMPLLTEDPEDALQDDSKEELPKVAAELELKHTDDDKSLTISDSDDKKTDLKDSFIDTAGLCAMRGGICNSLSEPPPDMFDFTVDNQTFDGSSDIAQSTDLDIPSESSAASNSKSDEIIENEEDDDKLKVDESKPGDVMYSANTHLELDSPNTNTDDSCEIPVQPEIVTDLISKDYQNDGDIMESNFESNCSINDGGDI